MSITTRVTDIRDCVDSEKVVCDYNYANLNNDISELNEVVTSRITVGEIEDKIFQMDEVEISQHINGEYYYPHDEVVIFEDLLKLARQGQLINVVHLDMGIKQHYYLVIEVLDQKLIWKISGSIWRGLHAC